MDARVQMLMRDFNELFDKVVPNDAAKLHPSQLHTLANLGSIVSTKLLCDHVAGAPSPPAVAARAPARLKITQPASWTMPSASMPNS